MIDDVRKKGMIGINRKGISQVTKVFIHLYIIEINNTKINYGPKKYECNSS